MAKDNILFISLLVIKYSLLFYCAICVEAYTYGDGRTCHCDPTHSAALQCDVVSGRCVNGRCAEGWAGYTCQAVEQKLGFSVLFGESDIGKDAPTYLVDGDLTTCSQSPQTSYPKHRVQFINQAERRVRRVRFRTKGMEYADQSGVKVKVYQNLQGGDGEVCTTVVSPIAPDQWAEVMCDLTGKVVQLKNVGSSQPSVLQLCELEVYSIQLDLPEVTPSVVMSLSARATSPGNVTASWQRPAQTHGLAVEYYYLQHRRLGYRACNSSSPVPWSSITEVPGDQADIRNKTHNMTLAGSYLEYEIKVAAQLDAVEGGRRGDFSRPVTVATQPTTAPSGQVRNISARKVQERSITWAWDDPPCETIHGPFSYYDVTLHTSSGVNVNSTRTSRRQHTFSGLTPYTGYAVRVKFVTTKGPGPMTASEGQKTDQAAPGPMKSPSVSKVTGDGTRLDVSWAEPDEKNGVITGYRVTWQDQGSPDPQCQGGSPNTQSHELNAKGYRISNLKPYWNYSVEIEAKTVPEKGYGPAGDAAASLTEIAAPNGTVTNLRLSPAPSKLRGDWDPPACEARNGPLAGLRYSYSVTDVTDNTTLWDGVMTRDTWAVVSSGLVIGHEYVFAVKVVNSSVASPVIEKIVIPSTPPPPTSPTTSTTTKPPGDGGSSTGEEQKSGNAAAIGGGVGGALVVILVIVVVLFVLRRCRSQPKKSPRAAEAGYMDMGPVSGPRPDSNNNGGVGQSPAPRAPSGKPLKPAQPPKPAKPSTSKKPTAPPKSKPALPPTPIEEDRRDQSNLDQHAHPDNKAEEYQDVHFYAEIDDTVNQYMRMSTDVSVNSVIKEVQAGNMRKVEQLVMESETVRQVFKMGDSVTKLHSNTPMSQFHSYFQKQVLRTDDITALEHQYLCLEAVKNHYSPEELTVATRNLPKNRTPYFLPGNQEAVVVPIEGSQPVYINAVFVDGYKGPKAFITTQMPLSTTNEDFWNVVMEHDVNTVVMLNPLNREYEALGLYWMDKELTKFGNISVFHESTSEDEGSFVERKMIVGKEEKTQRVTQLEFLGWREGDALPSTEAALTMAKRLQALVRQSGPAPVLMHCISGVERCGVMVGLSQMVERLEQERTVDVYHTVKTIRDSRPQFITSLAQYEFLHRVMVDYISELQVYANYKNE